MVQMTFYARGDSNTANNASINSQGISTTPTATLVFDSGLTGDIQLDYNGGLPDPDTIVYVNGTPMTFTVEFTGTLPFINKLSNVNGQDLRGWEVVVITTQTGQRYFFLTDGVSFQTMNAFPNGAIPIQNVSTTGPILICFVRGTLIQTPTGERPVETLQAGDPVTTADGGEATLRWVAHRTVSPFEQQCFPGLRPVQIVAGTFGPARPRTDLTVSAQHRMLFSGAAVEMMFAEPQVLVPAAHMIGLCAQQLPAAGPVDYFHLLFDRHEVVLANGLPAESFHPTPENLAGLNEAGRASLEQLCTDGPSGQFMQRMPAAATLRRPESRALLQDVAPAPDGGTLAGTPPAHDSRSYSAAIRISSIGICRTA